MATSDKGITQKSFKYNYIDQVQHLVPELYEELDYRLYGDEEDSMYSVLGKILKVAKQTSSLLTVSGFTEASSFYPYFLPENKKTNVDPLLFSRKILKTFGKTWSDFKTQQEFLDYVSGTILPSIRVNDFHAWAPTVSATVDSSVSSIGLTHEYLINNLGWLYFLNTSGEANADPTPSSLVTCALGDVFFGDTIKESRGVQMLFEYIWRNRERTSSTDYLDFLPFPWTSTSASVSGNHDASGDLLLNPLKTSIDIWLTDQDENSQFLSDSLALSVLGQTPVRMESAGAMSKFLKAVAYGFYDMKTLVRDVGDLLDIDSCPPEFLDYLANYVGWKLLTDDVDKWRNQLRQAIYVYKSKGTRQSIDYVINELIPSSIFDPNNAVSGISETWESYLPNLLYYLIRTESPVMGDMTSLRSSVQAWRDYLQRKGIDVPVLLGDDVDSSCRFLVDSVLHYMHLRHDMIQIGHVPYTETPFWTNQGENPSYFHRGKNIKVPPWEHDRFYLNSRITPSLVFDLSGLLQAPVEGLGMQIPSGIVNDFSNLLQGVVELKDDSETPLAWGDNQGFKFFTSSQQLAPNYKDIIARGDLESASLLDYWNSKSSTVFTKLDNADIDFSSDTLYSEHTGQLGKRAIDTIIDVMRQFAPFHVINKIYVGMKLHDDYFIPQRRDFLKWEDASSFGRFDYGFQTSSVADVYGGSPVNLHVPSGWDFVGINTSGNNITSGVSATGPYAGIPYLDWEVSSSTRNIILGVGDGENLKASVFNHGTTRYHNIAWTNFPGTIPNSTESYEMRYSVVHPGTTSAGDFAIQWKASTGESINLPTSAVGDYSISGYINGINDFKITSKSRDTSGLKLANIRLVGYEEAGWMFDKDYQNDGVRPSSIESIAILTDTTDYETNILNSYSVSAFRGTSGMGIISGIGPASSYSPPQAGRFIPSATWFHNNLGEEFWNVGIQDGAASEAPRDVSRRRNLRYALPSFPHTRAGKSDVMSTDFMSTTGLNPLRGSHASGFIPRGFNFSSNLFYSTTGTMSGVYDSRGDSVVDGISASSYHPSRIVPDMEANGSSIPTWRDQMGSNIMRAIIKIFLRRSKMDERWLRFDEDFILDFKFGTQVNRLYGIYARDFSRQLRNFVSLKNPFEGGYNIIAHAFGPLVENHSLSLSGLQHVLGDSSVAFPLDSADTIGGTYPHWQAVFGGGISIKRHGYFNFSGGEVFASVGQFAAGARNTYTNPADHEELPSYQLYSNKTLLSGIEIVSLNADSLIIWNQPNPFYRISPTHSRGVSFLHKVSDNRKENTTRLRWNLNGGKNLLPNGSFKYPPNDFSLNGKNTSSYAGWNLMDETTTTVFSAHTGGLSFISTLGTRVSPTYFSGLGSGYLSGYEQAGHVSGFRGVTIEPCGIPYTVGAETGGFGSAERPTIKKSFKGLHPSSTYELSFNVSADRADTEPYFTVWNKTKGECLSNGTSNWYTDIEGIGTSIKFNSFEYNGDLSSIPGVNIGASVASHAGTWYTYTFPFATKNEFDSNDEYEVLMNASTSDSGQTPQDRPLCISNIKVSEVTPPDPSKLYSTGVQGNRLAPDSDYRIKVAGLKTYPHGGSQNLFVRLVTEPSPLVGHGVPNTRWGYVWDERRWVPSTFTSDSQWKKLEFTAAKEEIHPFEFNTKNYRTPLGYLSLASGVDLIHTSSTAYYLEFAKSEADETNGVTLLGVELVNVNMNNLLEDYTKDDFLTVFSYFDDLGVSKLSRDISKSASEYGTSGGSRSEYMEFYGGSVSASDGVYEFIEDEG